MTTTSPDQCIICFEAFSHAGLCLSSQNFHNLDGSFCLNNHFVCNKDFVQYCNENVFPEMKRFTDRYGRIPCPIKECKGHFDEVVTMSKFDSRMRIRYRNLVEEKLFPIFSSVKLLSNSLRDVLTLCCPHCHLAIDPYPDACSAVLCLNCSSYYCNACFAVFHSDDTTQDRANAHEHVATHKVIQNEDYESRDAFLSESLVKKYQQEYQQNKICKFLKLALTSRDFTLEHGILWISLCMILCYDDILLLGIDPVLCWTESLVYVGLYNMVIPFGHSLATLPPPPSPDPTASASSTFAVPSSSVNVSSATEIGFGSGSEAGLFGVATNSMTGDMSLRSATSMSMITSDMNTEAPTDHPVLLRSSSSSSTILDSIDSINVMMHSTSPKAPEINSQSGQILANAMLSNNNVAIEQMFQSYRHHIQSVSPVDSSEDLTLQVNYKARVPVDDPVHPYIEYPLLSLAILLELEDVAIELIQFGADLFNMDNQTLHTSLYIIIEKGALKVFEYILEHYPEIDLNSALSCNATKYSALLVAARYNQYAFIDKIIAHGGEIDQQEEEISYTPLALSLVMDCLPVARLLLTQYRPNLTLLSKESKTSTGIAVERGHLEILSIMLTQHPHLLNEVISPKDHRTMLHIAIVFNQNHIVAWLLKHLLKSVQEEQRLAQGGGQDTAMVVTKKETLNLNVLDCTDEGMYSPVMLAIHYANPTAAMLILQTAKTLQDTYSSIDRVLDLENSNVHQKEAIYLATERGYYDVVKALIEYHFELLHTPCVTEEYYPVMTKYTPIHIAIEFDKETILQLIIDSARRIARTQPSEHLTFAFDVLFQVVLITTEEEAIQLSNQEAISSTPSILCILRNKPICLQILFQAIQEERMVLEESLVVKRVELERLQKILQEEQPQGEEESREVVERLTTQCAQIQTCLNTYAEHILSLLVKIIEYDRSDALFLWYEEYGIMNTCYVNTLLSELPNQPKDYQGTILHYAIVLQNVPMIIMLIDYGAEVTRCDSKGYDALRLARQQRRSEETMEEDVVQYLEIYYRKNQIDVVSEEEEMNKEKAQEVGVETETVEAALAKEEMIEKKIRPSEEESNKEAVKEEE